jgi:hypothetical protein
MLSSREGLSLVWEGLLRLMVQTSRNLARWWVYVSGISVCWEAVIKVVQQGGSPLDDGDILASNVGALLNAWQKHGSCC